jgi:hypothetical protein
MNANILSASCTLTPVSPNVNLSRTRSLYDEGFMTIMIMGGPGRMTIKLDGEIELDHASGKWSFSGKVSAPPDRINFDPQRPKDQIDNPQPGERGPWAEWITHQVKDFNDATGMGKDYFIYFDGDRTVTASGCCPKGTSYGY